MTVIRTPMTPLSRRPLWARVCVALMVLAAFAAPMVAAWNADRIAEAAQRAGPSAVDGVQSLRRMLALPMAQSDIGRLTVVNEFYNRRLIFREDLENWGQADYWASPLESLQKGQADCEDYALAKYFTLVSLGVPHANLRLVYVRATLGGPGGPVIPHMVLTYYSTPESDPLILDNLITEVRPAVRRQDLQPVFSFNADGVWEGVGAVRVGGSATDRLSRWREVLQRAHQEGFF